MSSSADLPHGWAVARLGNLGDWGSGGTPSKSNKAYYESGTIPWLVIGDLNESVVYRSNLCITEEGLKNSSAKLLPTGTLLVAMYGSIGKTAITGVQCATNQAIAYCQPHEGINLNYLHRIMQWLKPNLIVQGKGGTQQNISQGILKNISVPLAPSNEQRRIADKLDRVLARVDAANEHLSRVGPLLKRFRQEVLASAFTGGLTENFRSVRRLTAPEDAVSALGELPRPNRYKTRTDAVIAGDYALSVNDAGMDIPAGWLWIPMVDIARMESGHTPSKSVSAYWGGDVPWIGIADARNNHSSTIDDTIQKTSKLGLANSAARLLPAGTVCVSRTASVGYVVKMGRPMATSQDFVNWVCADVIDPDWLKWLFVAERRALHRFGKGSTHTTVYFPEWLSLHVALPSIEEQREIVARIDCLMEYADELEDRLLSVKTKCQAFVPALLSKAFRGELVSQNPNDEPASELLARLAEAEASENQKRIRRKRQASA